MGRLFKRSFVAVGGILALLLVTALALPFLIDVNDYKDEIADAVGARLGRDVTIDGDIGISVVPWLGLELDDVRLANAEGFGETPLASIRHLRIRVEFWPLFSRRLVMDTLTLDGLSLDLATDAQGRTNWDGLLSRTPSGDQDAPDGTGQGDDADGARSIPPELAALALGGIVVDDARLSWRDERSSSRFVVAPLDLETGPVVPGRPIDVNLHARVASTVPEVTVELTSSARLRPDPVRRVLAIEDWRLDFDSAGPSGGLPALRGRLGADIGVDAGRRAITVGNLALDLEASGPSVPGERLSGRLAADLTVDLAAGRVGIGRLDLETAGLKAELEGQVVDIGGRPELRGRLTVPPFDPRPVLDRFAVDLPVRQADGVLEKAALETGLEASSERLRLAGLSLIVDDSTLSGEVTVAGFDRPAIGFALGLDALDLDRYRPPGGREEATGGAPPAAVAAAAGTTLPIETLRGLDIDGRIRAGRLKVGGLKLADLRARLRADRGLIRLAPVSAILYGGRYQGEMALDARQSPPSLTLDERLVGIDIDPLLMDLTGRRLAFGRGDAELRVEARGQGGDEIVASLDGRLGFDLRDGGIHGVALADMLVRSGVVPAERLHGWDERDQTVFRRLNATATITKGVVRTDDLRLDSAQLEALGRGWVDLGARRLDLRVDAHPRKQLARLLGDLGKLAIPVRIDGDLMAPDVRIDVRRLLETQTAIQRRRLQRRLEKEKERAKRRLEEKARRAIEEERRRLEERLKKSLKGLFQ